MRFSTMLDCDVLDGEGEVTGNERERGSELKFMPSQEFDDYANTQRHDRLIKDTWRGSCETPQSNVVQTPTYRLKTIMATTELLEENCYVALTHEILDPKAVMDRVRSPKAGAIVLFAGT